LGRFGLRNCFTQLKFHSIRMYAYDLAATDLGAGGKIELLANLGAQHLCQMPRVIAGEGGAVSRDFISNPPTASHFRSLIQLLVIQ
jgi:hypothetical protein